ncbi:MAG: polysaccharide deacetylase family protein [Rhodothermales bacterium]
MSPSNLHSAARRPSGRRVLALALLLLGALAAPRAQAQGIHPEVTLTQPYDDVANGLAWLSAARTPQIGILAPPAFADSAYATEKAYADEVVRGWEYFLVGLDIPYRILEDSSLTDASLAPLRLIVLPASSVMSAPHQAAVRRYIERGGGVIASGPIATMAAPGEPADDRFMQDVFGLRLAGVLPDTINGVDVSLRGGHPITDGLPDGYAFNVGRAPGVTLAVPLRNESLGSTKNYSGQLLSEDPTLFAHGRFGAGEFVWMGFTGRDVSRIPDSQQVFQALMINAMACLTRTPAVAIRPWPRGAKSAFVLAVLPEIGHQPYQFLTVMDVLMEALRAEQAPATFFLTTDETIFYPQLVRQMGEEGEVALSADTDELLAGQPPALQRQRLEHAMAAFEAQTGQRPAGLYAPGGLYDVETLKTAHELGLSYVLDATPGFRVPTFVRWERELDYRDSLLLGGTPPRDVVRFYPSELTNPAYWGSQSSPNAMIVRMASALKGDLDRIETSGGLFLYAFEPGIQALTKRRADVIEALARHARLRGSWMTTLGEVGAWWKQRDNLSVRLQADRRDEAFDVVLQNDGPEAVRAVTLAMQLYDRSETVLDVAGADWRLDEASNALILVVDTARPGETVISVRLAPRPESLSSAIGR